MSTLSITTIQSNLHWKDKAANLKMFEDKIKSIKEKTELIVLPEMFSTGFVLQPRDLAETMEGETIHWMRRLAAEKKVIITGSVIIMENDPGAGNVPPRYYNRLIWMLPNGQYGYYDKRHRFAYAGEDENYTPGAKRLIASVKGWKINLLVCYDLRFPVWSRQTPALPDEVARIDEGEYDVLIYVANWPEKRNLAWRTLLRARAIENQCYVIGTNRTGDDGNDIHYSGDSMVIDPLGEILYEKKDEEDINTITLNKADLQNIREKFPFLRDSDQFTIL